MGIDGLIQGGDLFQKLNELDVFVILMFYVMSEKQQQAEHHFGRDSKHPEHMMWLYERWKGLRARCNNANHKHYCNYGAKGIKVCQEWNDFENFASWVLEQEMSPTVEFEVHRKESSGPYAPWNCSCLLKADHRALHPLNKA